MSMTLDQSIARHQYDQQQKINTIRIIKIFIIIFIKNFRRNSSIILLMFYTNFTDDFIEVSYIVTIH
jgi:hypothetical protein